MDNWDSLRIKEIRDNTVKMADAFTRIADALERLTEYKKWEVKPNVDKPTVNTTCVGVAMALVEDEPQTERSGR